MAGGPSFAPFAKDGAIRMSWAVELGCGTYLHHRFRPLIDFHFSCFLKGVGAITAPMPLFRFEDKSALYWVAVHVAEFLDAFALAADVEVREAMLP